jgi:hypothetical protein
LPPTLAARQRACVVTRLMPGPFASRRGSRGQGSDRRARFNYSAYQFRKANSACIPDVIAIATTDQNIQRAVDLVYLAVSSAALAAVTCASQASSCEAANRRCNSALAISAHLAKPMNGINARATETRLRGELRNVVANHPPERSHRSSGIRPNSGHRDNSRLSGGAAGTQLRPSAKISAG